MLELCDLITSTTTPYEYRVQGKRLAMKLKHHSRDEYKNLNDTSNSNSSVELSEMKSLPLSLGGQHGGGHLGGQHGGGGQHLGWQHGGGQHGCGGHLGGGGQHGCGGHLGGGGQGGGGQQESKNKNLEQICMKKIRKTVGNGKKNYR
jgi:hypothetical protein